MAKNEDLKAKDDVQTSITVPTGPSTFVKVKVIAENGIFKAGKLHKQDSELTLELNAANRFAEVGEVEILEDEDE